TRVSSQLAYLNNYGAVTASDWQASEKLSLKHGGSDNDFGYAIEFSLDGTKLAAGTTRGLFIFDLSTNSELIQIPALAQALSFSPDNQKLAAVTDFGILKIYEAKTGQVLTTSPDYW